MDDSMDAGAEALVPASRKKRFFNMLADLAGFYVFLTLALLAIGVTAPHFLARWKAEEGLALGTNLAAFFLYYVICEGLTLRSPGKLLTRTRVVSWDGGVPSFGQIVVRTLLRHFPFEWLPLLAGSPDAAVGLPLHDRWSRTLVIDAA